MFKNSFHRPFKVLLASKGAFSGIANWHLSSLLLVEYSADTCRISLIFFAKVRGTSILKEYILVIEGTACTSHNLRKKWLTQPLPPVLSDGQVVGEYCRQSVERLGESHLCKTMAGAVPSFTNIYSLGILYCMCTVCRWPTVLVVSWGIYQRQCGHLTFHRNMPRATCCPTNAKIPRYTPLNVFKLHDSLEGI